MRPKKFLERKARGILHEAKEKIKVKEGKEIKRKINRNGKIADPLRLQKARWNAAETTINGGCLVQSSIEGYYKTKWLPT